MEKFTFCLGGERRECSVEELSWRLDFYNQSKAMTEGFGIFLDTCHTSLPEGMNGMNWWKTISNGVHIPSITQEGDISSPIHRLTHSFIASTINMRKDKDKVPNLDILFLWSILTLGFFCNIPYCLAKYLAKKVTKDRKFLPNCGGMLVTKLARSYGLFDRGAENLLTLMSTRRFNILLYKRVTIMQDNRGNSFSIPEVDEAVQPELGRRVRARPNNTHGDLGVIPVEEEMPMDLYNRSMHRYQDNVRRSLNIKTYI